MSESARAAVFVGVGKPFDLRQYPVPDPGPSDLVVQISQANVCGSDLHIWRGDTDLARMGLRYGMILGHEMVGRVWRRGGKVTTDSAGRPLADGDRVVFTYYFPCTRCRACQRGAYHACLMSLSAPVRPCDAPPHFVGGFADCYYVRSGQKVFRVPDAVGDDIAAAANCALSQVLHGLEVVHLALGEDVVIQGAGGLGLYACAVAREMGAGRIIAIDSVPERLELARGFGADEVIDLDQVADPRHRVDKVMSLTGGEGADVVVEVAGVPEAVPEGIRMLARGGRYLELGNINPKRTYSADPSLLVGHNRSIHGVSLYPAAALRRAVEFLARTRDRYPYARLAARRYRLEEIDRAFREGDAFAFGRPPEVARPAIVPSLGS